jgi:Na+/H+ antiporter NhaA
MILPLFAFANAGVSFSGMTATELTGGVAVGIAAGSSSESSSAYSRRALC